MAGATPRTGASGGGGPSPSKVPSLALSQTLPSPAPRQLVTPPSLQNHCRPATARRTSAHTVPSSPSARALLKHALSGKPSPDGKPCPDVTPRPSAARADPVGRASTTTVPRAAAGGGVDVATWLKARKEKDAERERSKAARLHQDSRFIEKLERQQVERNAQLADEEDRRLAALAAAQVAASWQTQAYVSHPTTPLTPDATEEEALLRLDAERLFGNKSLTPMTAQLAFKMAAVGATSPPALALA